MSKEHEITSGIVEDFRVEKQCASTLGQRCQNFMKIFCGSLQSRIVRSSEGTQYTYPSQKKVINDGN